MKITTKSMILKSFFIALIILMTLVPNVGYITTPWVKITLIHIPVIVGGMLYGKKFGLLLGLTFGLSSLFSNTFMPTILSFLFSPFYSVGNIGGGFASLLICFIPRILTGYTASLFADKKSKFALFIRGFLSSMVNTILVVSGIYIFYVDKFAMATKSSPALVIGTLITIVLVNGITEAVAAGICSTVMVRIFNK